jgi:outer membrane protein assembly factor BamB
MLRRSATFFSLTFFVLIALILSASMTVLSADDWPHWRGPAASGASSEAKLPERWSPTENIAWKAPLAGVGVSSPIVWRDHVFVTSQSGTGASRTGPRLGQGADATPGERSLGGGAAAATASQSLRFLIEAFRRTDGRRLWSYELPLEGPAATVHDKHNLASASPVTDGERVYAVFGSGQVVAVDMAGRQVWTRNLAAEFGAWDIQWGNGSSPILHRGALIMVAYHPAASYLIAMDAVTGKQRWKTDRPKGVTSYSTPLVVPAPQGDELIVNSSAGVEAYDPATGRELWHFAEPNQYPIPVAMHHAGVIYLTRGYRSGPYAAIRPGGRGDISKTHVVWHVPTGAPYISSLVHYDGLLYMAGDVGIVTCVDAKTGERVWRERLGGVYTASPVAGDGKIYLLSETGETLVLRAGRTPQVIARNAIDGRTLASPAIAGGRLFIRTDDHIIAISGGPGT